MRVRGGEKREAEHEAGGEEEEQEAEKERGAVRDGNSGGPPRSEGGRRGGEGSLQVLRARKESAPHRDRGHGDTHSALV